MYSTHVLLTGYNAASHFVCCLLHVRRYIHPVKQTQMQVQVRPFINEAHYYADATIMFPVWPPEQQSVYTSNNSDTSPLSESSTQPRTVTGWGLWLAQAVWKEVQLRSAQHDSAPGSTHGPLPILAHSLNDITS